MLYNVQAGMFFVQVLKRTLQTALVWTIYEELKPFLMQQAQKFSGEQQS